MLFLAERRVTGQERSVCSSPAASTTSCPDVVPIAAWSRSTLWVWKENLEAASEWGQLSNYTVFEVVQDVLLVTKVFLFSNNDECLSQCSNLWFLLG